MTAFWVLDLSCGRWGLCLCLIPHPYLHKSLPDPPPPPKEACQGPPHQYRLIVDFVEWVDTAQVLQVPKYHLSARCSALYSIPPVHYVLELALTRLGAVAGEWKKAPSV